MFNKIGCRTLICALALAAIVLVVKLIGVLPHCETGDSGIKLGGQLLEGCK